MKKLVVLTLAVILTACTQKSEPIVVTPNDLHNAIDKVTEIMIHDIFSPPVASRIFAYPNIAAYEIIALQNEDYTPLEGQVKELKAIPKPDANVAVNYQLAALIAHIDLSRRLIFSEEKLTPLRDSLYTQWEAQNKKEFTASKAYGLEVAEHIAAWMNKDNYNQTRTMPKFTVEIDNPSRWQPTPPAYMEGIEPHWNKIRPFVINSADQFKPAPPPPFSMEEGSEFYNEVKEVYDISNEITKKGDESEEIAIAQFWDCNPYVSVTRGHLMFATKKITPGAHWIGIVKIATKKTDSDFDKTLFAYTKTSIAIA
ncbi:MAG: phosphatidic acid phosphatase, partial [Flavobacteriaceae bacterium]